MGEWQRRESRGQVLIREALQLEVFIDLHAPAEKRQIAA